MKETRHGLVSRDAGRMGANLGSHAIRVAVKDSETNRRMIPILSAVLIALAGATIKKC